MIFLAVFGVLTAAGILIGLVALACSFWLELSDCAWWGFACWLATIGVILGTAAQIAHWLGLIP